MENLVFTELVKRGLEPNRDLFYYKTRNDREVDFVIRNNSQIKELIQIAYSMADPIVAERETQALLEAGGELPAEALTVLTWDEDRVVKKNGQQIHCAPFWQWAAK